MWIVEMLVYGGWEATVGAALCRSDGRLNMSDWRRHNPNYRFRLVKYRPVGSMR